MFSAVFWFLTGLSLGLLIVGFIALGSYDRGYRSAEREPFRAELRARRRGMAALPREEQSTPERLAERASA